MDRHRPRVGQAIAVHGAEHFLRANHILTCSCAPIVDPFGRTLAHIDVSGDPRGFSPHTLALVRMSAQLIENHLFANQCAEALRVRFHAHEIASTRCSPDSSRSAPTAA
ncbi:GAF domain-containing protein [Burkholderia multivorans]|uniref:GAF domain-containing protein n=1 Tax=Burkholderia multivorans TaxID=87883 RepID=UPI00338D6C8B|nr:GAF domain-containing protein [Burkholderia multivorans]